MKYEKLAAVVHVLQNTAEKCTKIYNTRVQPLFCSLNLLFDDLVKLSSSDSGFISHTFAVIKGIVSYPSSRSIPIPVKKNSKNEK